MGFFILLAFQAQARESSYSMTVQYLDKTAESVWQFNIKNAFQIGYENDFIDIPSLTTEIVTHVLTGYYYENSCEAPTERDFYYTWDEDVYLYFAIEGANVGDKINIKWYGPDSKLYEEDNFSINIGGDSCFYSCLLIENNQPSEVPGQWHVDFYYDGMNGKMEFTEYFSIYPESATPILCIIETLLFEDEESLNTLRKLRDEVLSKTKGGRALIDLYYKVSPAMVEVIEDNPTLKAKLLGLLKATIPLVEKLL